MQTGLRANWTDYAPLQTVCHKYHFIAATKSVAKCFFVALHINIIFTQAYIQYICYICIANYISHSSVFSLGSALSLLGENSSSTSEGGSQNKGGRKSCAKFLLPWHPQRSRWHPLTWLQPLSTLPKLLILLLLLPLSLSLSLTLFFFHNRMFDAIKSILYLEQRVQERKKTESGIGRAH